MHNSMYLSSQINEAFESVMKKFCTKYGYIATINTFLTMVVGDFNSFMTEADIV